MKILYVSGTRADYGLMRTTLLAIDNHPKLELEVIVTGMHLMDDFGLSVQNVEKDGFKIHRLNVVHEKDDRRSMPQYISKLMSVLVDKIVEIKPEIILVLGDRAEMLTAAIVGTYLNIPVAHIHGGDISSTADESARHAITKLSQIHFPATEISAERIRKMGERPEQIFVCGAPGLDAIFGEEIDSKESVFKLLDLNIDNKTALVLQHPVTIESEESGVQIRETLSAVKDSGLQAVIIYPNADAGGRSMIKVIDEFKDDFRIFENLDRYLFLGIMKYCDVMIGNSSSGIIESSSFKIPVINVGTRQINRDRSINVIDVGYDKNEIISAIKKGISSSFQISLEKCHNIYGDGTAGKRIADKLAEIEINSDLIQKQLVY